MIIVLLLLVCLSPSECGWKRGTETYSTVAGCLAAAQSVSASYQAQNPGQVVQYRCASEEREA
jgi:hypothetical protein